MRLFQVKFKGHYPVGKALFVSARSISEALEIANEQLKKSELRPVGIDAVREVNISEPGVVFFLSGDY